MRIVKAALVSVLVVVSSLTQVRGVPGGVSFQQSAESVEAFDFVQVKVTVQSPDALNPFTDVEVRGSFERTGSGKHISVDGFCDSADGRVFFIRFMPSSPGDYSYSVSYRQGSYETTHAGKFRAVDGRRRGIVSVDPNNHWHFIWEGSGEHYFWNGTTTYHLMGFQEENTIDAAIDRLHRLKVNRLRVLLYGRYFQPWGEPIVTTDKFRLWQNPWVAQRPDDIANPGFDYSRFNVAHWRRFERMLRHAREEDMIISVIFDIAGNYNVRPAEGSEDERRYFHYGVSRLAAFSNVTWDLGNEHDQYRKYPQWADELGPLVKRWDPYDHLTSAHNKPYRSSSWADMNLIQNWDRPIYDDMLNEREQQTQAGRIIPQVLEEYGYEDHYPIWSPNFPDGQSADANRRVAWQVSMAGCYQTTGETAKRGTGVWPDTGGGWVNGRGDDSMIMLQGYAHMVDFFTSFDWWKTEPHNELVQKGAFCLAQLGRLYVIYLSTSRSVRVKLEPGTYQVMLFNPRNGNSLSLEAATGPEWKSPEPPDEGDWVILLRK
jgi:hypothetical protein